MTIRKTDACENAILDSGFDAVFNSGVLVLRTGTQPALAQDPMTGTLLWTETLPADAFAAASAGVKAKSGTWQANGVGDGSAGWFRMKTSGDTDADTEAESRLDGSVTATGGGGDMTLDNVAIATGQSVTINTFSVSV